MEQTTIIDCYETKLKSEPQHEKYTPMNFAAFLFEIRDFVWKSSMSLTSLDSKWERVLRIGRIELKNEFTCHHNENAMRQRRHKSQDHEFRKSYDIAC